MGAEQKEKLGETQGLLCGVLQTCVQKLSGTDDAGKALGEALYENATLRELGASSAAPVVMLRLLAKLVFKSRHPSSRSAFTVSAALHGREIVARNSRDAYE